MPSSESLKMSMSGLASFANYLVPDNAVLPTVVDFLDHFPEALQVVVNCARKTEITRWAYLFHFVGKPRDLFEKCMTAGNLKTAASYLLVLHNLEPAERSSQDTVRLLKVAMARDDWQLCKELSRFLYSLDHTAEILLSCLAEAGALPQAYAAEYAALQPEKRRSPELALRRAASLPTNLPDSTRQSFAALSRSVVSPPPNLAGSSAPSNGAMPYQRPGTTARAMHYRMSSGSGVGVGLGSLLQRVGTPPNPNERFRRSISATSISEETQSRPEKEREADDDDGLE